jgi:hypothetical protein
MATKTEGSTPLEGKKGSGEINFSGEFADGIKVDIHGAEKKASANNKNKMNTSSAAGNQGRQAKGGGSPYATNDNFGPSSSGAQAGDNTMSPELANDLAANESGETPPSNKPMPVVSSAPGSMPQLGDDYMPELMADLAASERGERLPSDDPSKHASSAPGAMPQLGDKSQPELMKDLKDLEDKQATEKGNLLNKNEANAKKKLQAKVQQYAKKKKWKLLAGGLGVGGAFFLLMLLLFLLGTLLIPHFVSNVVGWQFVRLTRAAYESTSDVLDEQVADAADNGTAAGTAAAAKYASEAADDNGGTFQDIDKGLDPDEMNKVAKNMGDPDVLVENSTKAADGSERLTTITYKEPDSNTFTTTKDVTAGFDGNVEDPNIMKDSAVAQDVDIAEANVEDVLDPYKAAGPVYQEQADEPDGVLQGEIGTDDGGLDEDDPGFEDGATAEQAEAADTVQTYQKVNDLTGATSSPDSQVNDDATQVEELEAKDMADPTQVAQVVADDGNLPNNLINLINNDFVENALDSVASKIGEFLNPATGKLIPFCIVYEGSKFSGPTAQAQSNEVQRSAVLTMAVADQQKRGSPYFTANMAGAENWKLEGDSRAGGVTRSIPIERASGEKVTTTSQISTEGSPLGDLQNSGNILSALGVPFAGTLATGLNAICPAITNIWVNLALGLANIGYVVISTIFTGPGGDVAEAAGDAATEEAADAVTESLVTRLIAAFSSDEEDASGFDILKDFGKDVIIKGGLVAGATLAAKFYVMSQAGTTYSGITTGPQFDNGVDQGTNQVANAMVANAYGGRPLTNTESMEVQQDDNKTMADYNASQSAYQRYLAFSNPQSLASVLTDRVAINLNYGFFSSILADIGNIFNPASLMPQVLFGGVSGQANAAAAVDDEDYGDVQQGYSDSEYALIASNQSYKSPSANQYALDQSNEESQIAQTYSPCFKDSVATLLGTETNGVPDIVRDANGNVNQTQGLCSPQNLGPNNPQYGDLVFRYRLSLSYNTTISVLQGVANAT